MKKVYQKPTVDLLVVAQENMIAASNSLNIHEEELGASQALGNEEADFDVWK